MNYNLKLLKLGTMKVNPNTKFYRDRWNWENKYGFHNGSCLELDGKWNYKVLINFKKEYFPMPMFGGTKVFSTLEECIKFLEDQKKDIYKIILKRQKDLVFLDSAMQEIYNLEMLQ